MQPFKQVNYVTKTSYFQISSSVAETPFSAKRFRILCRFVSLTKQATRPQEQILLHRLQKHSTNSSQKLLTLTQFRRFQSAQLASRTRFQHDLQTRQRR